jgi:hypothetical protein
MSNGPTPVAATPAPPAPVESGAKSGPRRNVPPEAWGGAAWTFLHAAAYAYPQSTPSLVQQEAFRALLTSLRHTLPCHDCRSNFRRELLESPPTAALEQGADELGKWVNDLRNRVSKRLGKPAHTLARRIQQLMQGGGGGVGRLPTTGGAQESTAKQPRGAAGSSARTPSKVEGGAQTNAHFTPIYGFTPGASNASLTPVSPPDPRDALPEDDTSYPQRPMCVLAPLWMPLFFLALVVALVVFLSRQPGLLFNGTTRSK